MSHSTLELRAEYPGFQLDVQLNWSAQVLVLFGPSGSGKSTLLESIAGLRPEVIGRIQVQGRELGGAPQSRDVGWVPQDASLFPHLTVEQNIRYGATNERPPAVPAAQILSVLELAPLLPRRINGLSGGERQRVAVARALMAGAKLLLLDEPLAALDHELRARVLDFLLRIRDELKIPMIYVSHDPTEVRAIAGEVAVLSQGRVIAQGAAEQVFGATPVLSVLEIMGVENVFEATLESAADGITRAQTLGGTTLILLSPPHSAGPGLRLAVRADDLLISVSPLTGISAQNCLSGRIESIEATQRGVWIKTRVNGELWIARVTQNAVDDLGLDVGSAIWLALKAGAIHVLSGQSQ